MVRRYGFLLCFFFFTLSLASVWPLAENKTDCKDGYIFETVEKSQSVISNSLTCEEWIVGLEDGSFWKLRPLKEKRKQTWPEWWNNITPAEWSLPQDFFFDPKEWKGSLKLNVRSVEKPIVANCFHLLENVNTGQRVFAEFIPFGDKYIPSLAFADRFFDHPYKTGLKLSSTIVKKSDFLNNLIVLDDDSCWKLFPFQKNKESWPQWFKGEKVDQPDKAFSFALTDWNLNDNLEIYFLQGDSSLEDKYAVQKKSRFDQKGLYLVANKDKSYLAYAQKVTPGSLIEAFTLYAEKRYDEGYSKGYGYGHSAGYLSGYNTAKENAKRDAWIHSDQNSLWPNNNPAKAAPPSYDDKPPPYTPETSLPVTKYNANYNTAGKNAKNERLLKQQQTKPKKVMPPSYDDKPPPYNPSYVPEPTAPPMD